MAGSADDDQDQPPARGREIEEGEAVSGYRADDAGSDTDTDDEDARYYLQSSHDNDQWVNASAASARGISPASSIASDWTVSDDAGVAKAGDAKQFPCRICGREFGGWKAVHGHMKVHSQATKVEKLMAAAVASGGGVSAVEEVGDSGSLSTAVVRAAMPRLFDDTITPVQSACTNNPAVNGGSSARSSIEPIQSAQSTVIPVAAHAPPAATLEQVPEAPQQQGVATQQQANFIPLMAPAAPPQQDPVGLHMTVGMAPAGNGFKCKECDRRFPTHQGLGGHVAGHKNRRIAAEAAAAAEAGIDPQDHVACRGGAKPAKSHACKICGAEYPSGVSLGGHMRKHYVGKPIVPRKRLRPSNDLYLAGLELALPLQPEEPHAMGAPIMAMPLAAAEPAVAPQPPQMPRAVPGTVRIFGVNFVQQANTEERPVDESMTEQI